MKTLSKDEFMRISLNILGLHQKALEDSGVAWPAYHNHLPTREEMWEELKNIPVLNEESDEEIGHTDLIGVEVEDG